MRRNLFATVLLVGLAATPALAQGDGKSAIRVLGRIRSVVHEGVPAAEVWVTDAEGKVLARTVADGEGLYQLPRLPDVPLRLHARAPGMVDGELAVPTVGLHRAASLMLEDGDPLRGTVTHAGAPVAGAAVLVHGAQMLESPFDWRAETVTDDQGAWSLPAAPLRALMVRAWSPGCAVSETLVPRHDGGPVSVVLLPGPKAQRRIRVTGVPKGQTVLVRCKTSTVATRSAVWLPTALREVAVAADGAFLLWPLPLFHEVEVRAPGCASYPVFIPCAANAADDLDFTLTALPADVIAPSTRFTGQVVDELGRPLAKMAVLVKEGGCCIGPVSSDAEGRFQIDVPVRAKVLCQFGLVAGAWRVGDPRAELEHDGITWLTVAADSTAPIKLHAMRAASIRGTLLAPSGAPIAAANVLVQRLNAQGKPIKRLLTASDASGRIDVPGLPAGGYLVTVRGEGSVEGSVRVELPAGDDATLGTLSFAAAGEVNGVVRGSDGRSMGGALLWMCQINLAGRRPGAPLVDQNRPVLTDRNGRFLVRGAPVGSWMLCQMGAGRAGQLAMVPATEAFLVEASVKITVDVASDR